MQALTDNNSVELVLDKITQILGLFVDIPSFKLAVSSMAFVIVRIKWQEDRQPRNLSEKAYKKRVYSYWYELLTVAFLVYHLSPMLLDYGVPQKVLPIIALGFGFVGMDKIISVVLQALNAVINSFISKVTNSTNTSNSTTSTNSNQSKTHAQNKDPKSQSNYQQQDQQDQQPKQQNTSQHKDIDNDKDSPW